MPKVLVTHPSGAREWIGEFDTAEEGDAFYMQFYRYKPGHIIGVTGANSRAQSHRQTEEEPETEPQPPQREE